MKAYFSVNHNPDAKQLKQLAQKTGLTKRVLQVIFNFLFVYNVDCDALSGMWKREKTSDQGLRMKLNRGRSSLAKFEIRKISPHNSNGKR